MTKLQLYMIAASAVLIMAGCAPALQTTTRVDSTQFTPPPISGQVQTHDSTIFYYVPVARDSIILRDSVNVRDSLVFHRMPFKVFTDTLITPHKDTLIHSLNTYTGKATWKGWQSAYAVAHTDTATIGPPKSEPTFFQRLQGYLAWVGVLMIGVVIGFIAKSMIKVTV